MHGRRLYVARCRIHHGLVGALLTAVGLTLMLHDRRDFPWPTADAI